MNLETATELAQISIKTQEALSGLTLSIVGTAEDEYGWEFWVAANGDKESLESYYVYVDGDGTVSTGSQPFIAYPDEVEKNMFGPRKALGKPAPVEL